MADLVERYVHQVGRFLPRQERAEIEAELRSQLQDQLDDRYGGTPSEAEIVTVLQEFGDPRMLAVSYRSAQYLVGPELYPFMMLALRRGWLVVPAIILFLHIFGLLVAGGTLTFTSLVVEPLLSAVQATLIFSGVVVLLFALIERARIEVDPAAFNPLALPEVDDPGAVDRFEVVIGAALAVFAVLVFLYFLRVGGLTLRFDLNNPGEVIPVPALWLLLLILSVVGQVGISLLALRHGRWRGVPWLVQTVLEVFGVVCLYFAVTKPLVERLIADQPNLADVFFIANGAELFAIVYAVSTLLSKGIRLVRLWNYSSSTPFAARSEG